MDEEDDGLRKQAARYVALSAAGDFMLMVGLLFVFWGIAIFVSDYLGIKGSGEAALGIVLIIAAVFVLASRRSLPKPAQKKPVAPETESYR